MAVEELKPVGSPQPAAPAEPVQQSGPVAKVSDELKDPADHVDPIKPDAPQFPHIDFDQIKVHLATQFGDADNADALQAKETYQDSYDKATDDLDQAHSAYSELGPGTHDLGDGSVVVITKQDGKISVVTTKKQSSDGSPGTTTTVTYNEGDPQNGEIVTETENSADGKDKTTVSKQGTTLVITDQSGRQTTYGINEKGGVVQEIREPGSSSLVRTETNSDGSTRVTSSVTGPDGKPTVETATHPPDQERAEIAGTVDQIAYVVNPDGSHSPLSPQQREILIRGLKKYGIETVRNLKEAGLTIGIIDEEQPPPGGYATDLPEWPPQAAGYYDPDKKIILLGQQSLEDGNGVGYFVHEVGHAIDDFLAEDLPFFALFRSDKDIKSVDSMYEAYKKRVEENPDSAWSKYAQGSRHEYVAEGIRYYLDPELRKQLAEKDPQLYAYVEAHLVEASKPHGLVNSK